MRYYLVWLIVVPLVLGGCVHPHPKRKGAHVHHHSGVVILYKKPAPKRHCWRHNGHWDCSR